MAEQSKFVVVSGGKPVAGVVHKMQASGVDGVREATTGRVVFLPQVWAVAEVPGRRAGTATASGAEREAPVAELAFYRKYTEALLRRYVQMTMEAGRVSSLMGREVLGGKASSYRIHGFDDAVIFRLDVEKCLRKLEGTEREVLRRIAMQEYTHMEAADLLQVSLRTVGTRYAKAIDKLTGILLQARLLEPFARMSSGEQLGQRS